MRIAHQVRRRPIPLTPLIDVVFLLLVFFLLASTFLREDVLTIRLAGGGADTGITEPVRIGLSADGAVTVDGEAVEAAAIGARVQSLSEGRAVVVAPDDGVPLEAVVGILDDLSRAGVVGVGLAR